MIEDKIIQGFDATLPYHQSTLDEALRAYDFLVRSGQLYEGDVFETLKNDYMRWNLRFENDRLLKPHASALNEELRTLVTARERVRLEKNKRRTRAT